MRFIDLNGDVGEGMHTDAAFIPCLSSANVACGGHAGDRETMRETLGLARHHGVIIGAHPGYEDRTNFGRVETGADPVTIGEQLMRQLESLQEMADGLGADVSYLKLHGALYHRANVDAAVAEKVTAIWGCISQGKPVLSMPGGQLERFASAAGIIFIGEAFPDRRYRADGALMARTEPGALFTTPDEMARQAVVLAGDLRHGSFCVHGDGADPAAGALAIRRALIQQGIQIRSFCA